MTVEQDHIINQVDGNDHNMKSKCISILKQNVDDLTWNDFITLKKQNIIIKFLTDTLAVHRITSWQKTVSNMPNNIFSFCRRALILALPTKANLKIWNISDDNICPLCNVKSQTQHHILNNCNAAVTQKRLTWRHDSVLHTIVHHLGILKDKGFTILADLPGFQSPNTIFESLRPDIVLCTNTIIYAIELTICFETNFVKSREYKLKRYENLRDNMIRSNKNLTSFFIEFSSLGFYSHNSLDFTKFGKKLGVDVSRMISKCAEVCIRSSYYIFNRRNKDWTNPDTLLFY